MERSFLRAPLFPCHPKQPQPMAKSSVVVFLEVPHARLEGGASPALEGEGAGLAPPSNRVH